MAFSLLRKKNEKQREKNNCRKISGFDNGKTYSRKEVSVRKNDREMITLYIGSQ